MKLPDQLSGILSKLDGKNRYYVFFGGLFVFLILDYFILMSPQTATLIKIKTDRSTVLKNIKKAKLDIQNLNLYRSQIKQMKKDIDEVNLQVKSKDSVPLVLEYITRLANDNGVKVDQIMPDSQELKLLLENDEKRYFSLPILIEARSGYHDFGRFLNEIENGDVSLKIKNFMISSRKSTRYHDVQLTFQVIVFEGV